MEYVIGSLVITVAIITVYAILSSRINSNLNKLEQKIQDLRYERQESALDLSQRMRYVESSLRDTERTIRNATTAKKNVQSESIKTPQKSTPIKTSKDQSKPYSKTKRDDAPTPYSSAYSSSEDTLSPSLTTAMMAVYQTTESSRADTCSSSSSYDSGSSSSSSCDSSSSF
jgi:Tfp pilus assembly protein PilX